MSASTVAHVARELRLSAWIFCMCTVFSIGIVVTDYLLTRRLDSGWPMAASVAVLAWVGAGYFARQLDRLARTIEDPKRPFRS
ncbi:MAG: hypothetical protein JO035_03205 [Betaproteobacteria bacterium]|nr:hypothetical protein [Betaproteobacteria bacterium]